MFKAISHLMKLLLPVLMPSWRFFDMVKPSPRIEVLLLADPADKAEDWQALYPRPDHMPLKQIVRRLFWNQRWNEALFLVSLAERMSYEPSRFVERELTKRVCCGLRGKADRADRKPFMQYRLLFVLREGDKIERHVTYQSPVCRLDGGGVA